MAGTPAATQHTILSGCRISHAACARSENLEFTGWALSLNPPRLGRKAGLRRSYHPRDPASTGKERTLPTFSFPLLPTQHPFALAAHLASERHKDH